MLARRPKFIDQFSSFKGDIFKELERIPENCIHVQPPNYLELKSSQLGVFQYFISKPELINTITTDWIHLKGKEKCSLVFQKFNNSELDVDVEANQRGFTILSPVNLGSRITDVMIRPDGHFVYLELLNVISRLETGEAPVDVYQKNWERVLATLETKSLAKPSMDIVEFLSSTPNFLSYVWGPPGTGKTYQSIKALNHFIGKGELNLVVSLSHQAVDNILLEYDGREATKNSVVRLGNPLAKNHEKLKRHLPENVFNDPRLHKLKEEMQSLREETQGVTELSSKVELISKLRLVEQIYSDLVKDLIRANKVSCFCTLAQYTVSSLVKGIPFDNVILEEASMVSLPFFLNLLGNVKQRIVCVGDPNQLPPVVRAEHVNLDKTVFDFFEVEGSAVPSFCYYLKESRRMPGPITNVLSESFYNSLLNSSPEKKNLSGAIIKCDLTGKCTNTENEASCAGSAKHLVDELEKLVAKSGVEPSKIGIISPFRKQKDFIINEILTRPSLGEEYAQRVLTVHAAQGDGYEYVFFDTVQYGNCKPNKFYTDRAMASKLLNVAISRTKEKLYIFYDLDFIKKNKYECPVLFDVFRKLITVD